MSSFSGCARGSSTFSACSAPVTGSAAGSSSPTCDEERRLVPVDVLVRDLAVLEAHDDAEREPHRAARRRDSREQLVHLDVVREREDELVDDLDLHRPSATPA